MFPKTLKIIYFLRWPFPPAKSKKNSYQVINMLLQPSLQLITLNVRVDSELIRWCSSDGGHRMLDSTAIRWWPKTSDKFRAAVKPFMQQA